MSCIVCRSVNVQNEYRATSDSSPHLRVTTTTHAYSASATTLRHLTDMQTRANIVANKLSYLLTSTTRVTACFKLLSFVDWFQPIPYRTVPVLAEVITAFEFLHYAVYTTLVPSAVRLTKWLDQFVMLMYIYNVFYIVLLLFFGCYIRFFWNILYLLR